MSIPPRLSAWRRPKSANGVMLRERSGAGKSSATRDSMSQDPDALRKAAEAVRVLEDRVVAIAQGQVSLAQSLRETADGLLVHKADDEGATAVALSSIADSLELLAREVATLNDSFRMLIADALGEDALGEDDTPPL